MQEALSVVTHVDRVVVHANGALVTRRGRVPAGARDVLVSGLPLLFAADTLRVRLRNGSVGVVDEVCNVSVSPAPPVAGLDALLDIRLQIAAVEQQKSALEILLSHSDIPVELPPADVEGLPDVAVLLRLAAGASRRREQLVQEIRARESEIRALRREESRRKHAVRPDEKPPRVLRGVRIVADAKGDADGGDDLDIEYFVPAARWVPSYALHLTNEGPATRARLVLGALVAQATGEDWTEVDLQVSTVDLRRETTLPVVHSWRLGRAQSAVVRGFRPLPSDLPGLFGGWGRFPAAPPTTTPATSPATSIAARPKKAPPPPPPPPVNRAKDEDDYESRSEGEVASFEQERTDAAFAALDDDGDGAPAADFAAAAQRERAAPEMSKSMMSLSMPAPSRTSAPMAMPVGRAQMAGPPGAPSPKGGGGALGGLAPSALVVDELPPRLRTSAMRMAGADEPQRGLLLPLDAAKRLEWMLDGNDLGPEGAEPALHELRRAVAALDDAARRLRSRALPRGTAFVAGSVAAVYGRAGRASIPGDGNDHRVEVHEDKADAAIVHLAVPRESLDVWRACRFQSTGPLPAGPVQVYEDGAFVVAGSLQGGGGGKTLVLNLGVDADVRIKARTPHAQQSEKGMLGGTTQMEHKIVTEVRSTRAAPVKLSLFERVPIADENQKDLVVSPVTSKPTATRTDKGPRDEELKGGLRFDLTLMPGDAVVVEHSYTLTLPAKSEVVGGNRRE